MISFMRAALPWMTAGLCVAVLACNHFKGKKKKEEETPQGNYMTEGMCLGLCIGLALGSEWMSLGMLIGLVIGVLIQKQ